MLYYTLSQLNLPLNNQAIVGLAGAILPLVDLLAVPNIQS